MFIVHARPGDLPKKSLAILTFLLILDGTLIRLVMAWFFRGNYDMVSWQMTADRFAQGLDPYSANPRYNYSPVWYWLLGLLGAIPRAWPALNFHFVVCSFLTLVDLATFIILAKILQKKDIPAMIPALFFYFNPVSFLLTGYHGQFDSLAVLCILVGLWRGGPYFSWGLSTLGTVVKQIVFFQILVTLNAGFKKRSTRLALFGLSAVLFAVLLVPYWSAGREDIIQNVFLYSSYRLPYGISTWFEQGWLKWLFVAGLAGFPFAIRKHAVPTQHLLMMLFFLVFTPGVGVQYFILPVALGTLVPTAGFILYTVAATFFLLGNYYNLHIRALSFIPWNAVWVAALVWFVLVLRKKTVPAES